LARLSESLGPWGPTYSNIKEMASKVNRFRSNVAMWEFATFCEFRKPDTADILEYARYVIKVKGRTPGRFTSSFRYVNTMPFATSDTPRFVCAFVKCDFLLNTEDIDNLMKCAKKDSARAYMAIGLSGVKYIRSYLDVRVEEYDPETRMLRGIKMTPFLDKYIRAQWENAKIANVPGNGPLLFRTKKDGTFDFEYDDVFTSSFTRISSRTGINVKKSMYLMYALYFANKEHAIRYM
jgi:hypothetical protein